MKAQLVDVVVSFNFVEISDDEEQSPYATSRQVKLDWEGTFEEFVELLSSSPKTIEIAKPKEWESI